MEERIAHLDWEGVERSLSDWGWAKTPPLLTPAECAELIDVFDDDRCFRSRIDMARYRFGVGEYKYFAAPLPLVVAELRARAYPRLALIANRWEMTLGRPTRYAGDLARFLAYCATHGQRKPTPLLLRYDAGGYNCLHQDLYGQVAFPLQLTCALSRRGEEYTGGESLLVEQRPRAQSRGDVVVIEQGEVLIFATRDRPVRGNRGYYRATMRHGVSRILSGRRYSLGVIFHDAT
ncbi:MAG: prolyl 4-hydroxylase subunit alpha [Candidatus Rokuibacteriota bacterium]|nr:MAG: prolyl 4-hydroxylase subunit alpha [Candidatus Rokubacteria bacterium]